jgi:PGF-CTERM protein/surface glycoprotein (TIGR04207 family)
MTGNRLRAVALAALMVLSAFVGSIAFAGSAAAAEGDGSATVSLESTDTGASTNHTWTHDIVVPGGGSADVQLLRMNYSGTGADLSDVGAGDLTATLNGADVTGSVSDVSTSSDGEVLDVSFGSQVTVNDGDTVEVAITSGEVVNPQSAGSYTASFYAYETTGATTVVNSDTDTFSVSDLTEAPGAPTMEEATSYANLGNVLGAAGDTHVEVVFSESMDSATVEAADFEVTLDDDSTVTPVGVADNDDDRNLQLSLGADVSPVSVEEVEIVGSVADTGGESTDSGTVEARTTSTTIEEGGSATESNAKASYTGERVAVFANEPDEPLDIETDDGEFVFSGSTGAGSHIYVFNTNNRNESATYEFDFGGSTTDTQFLQLRPLGLEVNIDDPTVYTEATVEGVVSANAGNRMVELGYTDYDDIDNQTLSLNGSGGADFTIEAPEDTGNYTLTATDLGTDASVQSEEIEVSDEPDGDIAFSQPVYEQQRGDLVNVTVNTENVDAASVTVGSFDAGYIANLTLYDEDEDGEVTFQMNSFNASTAGADAFHIVREGDDDDDEDSLTVESGGVASAYDELLPATSLDLEATGGADNYEEDAEAVATLSLRERNLNDFGVTNWRAPRAVDYPSTVGDVTELVNESSLTQSEDIALEDVLVLEVSASGMTGIIDAQAGSNTTEKFLNVFDEDLAGDDPADLSVMGPDDKEFVLSPASTRVVVDAESDTHYVFLDTRARLYTDDNENDAYDAGEEQNFRGNDFELRSDDVFTSNVTVYESDLTGFGGQASLTDEVTFEDRDAEIEIEGDSFTLPASANATLNATTTVAPGSTLSMRVESNEPENPFLRSSPETDVVLRGDQPVATATFDLSNISEGANFTATVSGSALSDRVEEDGTIAAAGPAPGDGNGTGNDTTTTDNMTTDGEMTTTAGGETTTAADGGTTTAADGGTTTAADGNATETTADSGPVPGFGIGVALLALLAAGALALRREN